MAEATDAAIATGDSPGGDTVLVESLGFPASREFSGPVRVLLLGSGEATRSRLDSDDGYEVLDDVGHASQGDEAALPEDRPVPDLVLVSTRLPRTEGISLVASHRERWPVVVLVHTGGEALAADCVRAGARGLIGEGNEAALRSFLSGSGHDSGLLEVYDRQMGGIGLSGAGTRSRDAVTGLANSSAFRARVTEAELSGDVPRIGLLRLLHLSNPSARSGTQADVLVLRRLVLQLEPLAQRAGVELFALGGPDFAFIGPELSPHGVEALAAMLSAAAEVFAPWGTPLAVAIGHAGAEVAPDPSTARRLAERAMESAALGQRSTVIAAETLALGASSNTELEAALNIVEAVERLDPTGPGFGAQVAELTASLAAELGYEGITASAMRFAAHLHQIGRAGLPMDAMYPGENASEDVAQAARSHPMRGADYLRPLVGAEIAAAVRAQCERWDGAGFPDGLAQDQIPAASRIIAVVSGYLRVARKHGPAEAASWLLEQSGTALDPAIVDVALPFITRRAGVTVPPLLAGAGA